VYTTCEVGKRRSVNHARSRSLASPSRAEAEAVGVGVGVGEARRGAARPAGRTCVCVRACSAVRSRTSIKTENKR
jgi:hypothetical protein